MEGQEGHDLPLAGPKFHGVQQVAPRKFPCEMQPAFLTSTPVWRVESSGYIARAKEKAPFLRMRLVLWRARRGFRFTSQNALHFAREPGLVLGVQRSGRSSPTQLKQFSCFLLSKNKTPLEWGSIIGGP
jgi:hypothetical protein